MFQFPATTKRKSIAREKEDEEKKKREKNLTYIPSSFILSQLISPQNNQ
jgi:hypothetical protein